MILLQKATIFQLHGKVQSCLSSHGRKHTVRFFLQDQLFHYLNGQRLNVHLVRDISVCHDGSRVGVQKHNLDTLLLQRTAALCTRIVKLRSLSDNDRAGANYQYLLYTHIPGHYWSPPIILINLSNRYAESCGPGHASGWNCVVKMFLPL